MTLWFYFLWSLAVFHVLFSSPLKVLTKLLWLLVIIAGIWLILGAFSYQKKYTAYRARRETIENERMGLLKKREKLEAASLQHPTSRDVLLHLAALSAQFGEREKLLEYTQRLREVDPNNEMVRKFLQAIQ